MPRKARPPLEESDIHGLKYLRAFEEILAPLRDLPTHGNRRFFMDQYVSLLLLHFFIPVLSSSRSLQQATGLQNVQETPGRGAYHVEGNARSRRTRVRSRGAAKRCGWDRPLPRGI